MAADIKPVMVRGRIVYTVGDLFKGDVAKTFGTQNLKLNKAGQSYREYGFGIAVPKAALADMGPGKDGEIWARVHEVAYTVFPNRQIPANFHMKYKDGDTGTNQDGTPLNTKKGYPGHIVFNCKTTMPIKFFRWENGQNFQVSEGIKCGDYVEVQLNINVHTGTNAGLYLNPNAVRFLGFGEEIVNAPSAESIFGSAAPIVPQGASATPMSPGGFITPPTGFAPPPGPMAASPMPQAYPQASAPQPEPHFGVLPQQFQQQAPMGAPQVPNGFPAGPAVLSPAAYPSNGMPPLPR